jgi:hypothetical protein
MTLAAYCATGAPSPKLCGLCALMDPDTLRRYRALWVEADGYVNGHDAAPDRETNA